MTAPRQPRQWVEGDPEPTDVYEVQHTNSQRYRRTFVTVNYGGSVVVRFWAWQSGPSGALLSWDTLAGRLGGYKLTEVLTDDEVPGVLPETPEPPKACECFAVPEERWTRHYDATEPGSMVEPNPDCPVHGSSATIPAPQSSPTPLLPLSVPVETEGQVEAADGDLSGSLATEARKVANSLRGEVLVSGEMMARRLRALADDVDEIALKVEGWSPPLPEGEDRPGHGGDPVRRAQFAEEKLAEVIGWCKDADAAAIKCVYVIDRIREVLVDFGQLDKSNQTTALEALEKIDAILDAIPSSLLPADEPGLLRRLSALFASTGRQHPAAWLADAATASEEGREWPVLPDKPNYAQVDVYGYDGRFLYAGLLQARADGGWNVFHHTDSRHQAQP